jgi:ABC-type nitrate/sulfonate/bicarbonate transport system permease component
LLFSALAAAGISRFMLGIFPAVIMASVLGLWWLVGKWLRASHAPLI